MSRRPAILIVSAALLGLLALPGGVAAGPTATASGANLVNALATDACAAEKSDIGKKAFKKRYGAKKGMKACVKRNKADARAAVTEATDECLWELEEYGDEEFYGEWGTFSACVEDYAAWIMDGGGFEEDDEGDEEEEEEDEGDFL
jgi:hypothetical protein